MRKQLVLAVILATTLSLSPVAQSATPNPQQPSTAHRAGTSDPESPIPGSPPLTQDILNRTTQFFEWLLDTHFTAEQRSEFRDSVVRSWKGHKQDEIDATLNVLKFQDQLKQKSPQDQRMMRELLQKQYLDSMRKNPNDVLSRWVLNTYYSAHHPIANGNPPLTAQMADAYAEFVSFLLTECLGKNAFNADRNFKDALARALAAQYSSYSPEQQNQFSQMPLLWGALRSRWATLSEAERARYRRDWRAAAKSLVAGQTQGNRTNLSGNSSSPNSLDDFNAKNSEHMFVNNMANSSFANTISMHMNMWH